MTSTIHQSKVGTYHPVPDAEVAWTVNDTRGYIDGGPTCDECGACECGPENHRDDMDDDPCVGLSFAYICLDGGEALCEACAEKAGIKIVPCDCE